MRLLKAVGQVLILFLSLLAIGLATRVLAVRLDLNFAFHAVLTALPHACLLAFYFGTVQRVAPLVLAVSIYGGWLGVMQPIMGVGVVTPLVLAVAWRSLKDDPGTETSVVQASSVFGGAAYPAVILAGSLLGHYRPGVTLAQSVEDVLYLILASCLAVLGAALGVSLAGRMRGAAALPDGGCCPAECERPPSC